MPYSRSRPGATRPLARPSNTPPSAEQQKRGVRRDCHACCCSIPKPARCVERLLRFRFQPQNARKYDAHRYRRFDLDKRGSGIYSCPISVGVPQERSIISCQQIRTSYTRGGGGIVGYTILFFFCISDCNIRDLSGTLHTLCTRPAHLIFLRKLSFGPFQTGQDPITTPPAARTENKYAGGEYVFLYFSAR